MNKYVIYTAIVGHYDKILQPKVVDDRFDYILFSNDIGVQNVGIWQVKPIYYTNEVQAKIARWVKTHPEELLQEYEFSIWMDANIIINTSYTYDKSIALFFSKNLISAVRHPHRNDIYSECGAVMAYSMENTNVVFEWLKLLHRDKYPKGSGLNETGLLYRRHCSKIKDMDERWWSCIDRYSRRDQLSFNYVLWKLQIECVNFLHDGQDVRNSAEYEYVIHSNKITKFVNLDSQIERYYGEMPSVKLYYYTIITNSKCPRLMFYMLNIYLGISCRLKIIIKTIFPKSLLAWVRSR